MKRVVFACLGMLGLAATANAADLPRRYDPVPQRAFVPVYNWTGFYIGINGGGAWGDSKWDSVGTFDVSGGMIGGTVGYNWQIAQWVFGLEGDIDWTNINGTLDRRLRGRLQDQQQLAGHGPRPRRLRVRPLPALHHRRSCGRQHQGEPAGLHRRRRHQRRLDRRRRPRIRHRRQLDREGRVSLCRSRQASTAASPAATASIRTTCRSARTWCAAA